MVSFIPQPTSPVVVSQADFADLLSFVSDAATRGSPPPSDSYAGITAASVDKEAIVTKTITEDDPDAPPPPAPLSDQFFWPPLETMEGNGKVEVAGKRSPSIEIIERPATWSTPTRVIRRAASNGVVVGGLTIVKSEVVTPDLRSTALIEAVPAVPSPEDPASDLGKHARPESAAPSTPSKSSRKKRRTAKSKAMSTLQPPPSSTSSSSFSAAFPIPLDFPSLVTYQSQSDARTVVSKPPSEAMLWDTLLSPTSSMLQVIENNRTHSDPSAAAHGPGATPAGGSHDGQPAGGRLRVRGDRWCGEAAKIEAEWSKSSSNGNKIRHISLLESIASPRPVNSAHAPTIIDPSRPSSVELTIPTSATSPRPISLNYVNSISATKEKEEDVVMRSPSPTITQILRERIPGHQKGKGAVRPVAGPSKPIEDGFFSAQSADQLRGPVLLNPDDTTCSVYPPQVPARHGLFANTPTHTASIIDRFQLFESTMASRGPPISRTLYASEFPAVNYAQPQRTPLPPQPYVEDHDTQDESFTVHSSLRDFVQQQAENAPAEQDDFLTMMPPPPGGFPPVHFTTPLGAYANTIDRQLLDWERERRAGLVTLGVSFYGFGALDGDVDPRYKQLLSYAAHTLNARFHTDRIMIAKPQPKAPVSQLNAAPHTALLYGLNHDEAEILSQEGVMCTTRLAMFFHKLDVVFPEYIGAIHGLTTRLIQPVYEMVLNHFLSQEADALLRELCTRPPNPITSPDRAQAHFANALYVRRLDCRARGNTHAPVFQVYMQSPATDYHSFRAWTAFCKKMNLTHSLYGTGYLKSPGVCAGCHGQDHPSGLCRFARLDGWLAPPPNSLPNFSIPVPNSTQDQQQQQQSRAPNSSSQTRPPRRRKGNGKPQHIDTPRP